MSASWLKLYRTISLSKQNSAVSPTELVHLSVKILDFDSANLFCSIPQLRFQCLYFHLPPSLLRTVLSDSLLSSSFEGVPAAYPQAPVSASPLLAAHSQWTPAPLLALQGEARRRHNRDHSHVLMQVLIVLTALQPMIKLFIESICLHVRSNINTGKLNSCTKISLLHRTRGSAEQQGLDIEGKCFYKQKPSFTCERSEENAPQKLRLHKWLFGRILPLPIPICMCMNCRLF